ncbi:MAG: toll/interleukin-1 receptor domain-containing protein, partial [Acidobacteriota bacterium]|nr:toll/interleukin-1 receptor domain-containing protein [Acidobacteriota bacterium]
MACRPAVNEKARLFYSYAHEDADLRDLLEKHLTALRRDGLIESWHDRDILPGAAWNDSISEHLEQADIILLLISVDFLASPYCTGTEMSRALEREKRGEATVIPILLRPVELTNAPFRHLQFLPDKGKPVVEWRNRDEAFVDVARGIRRAVEARR